MGLNAGNTALLIIDMQEKLFAAIHEKETVLKNVVLLVHLAKTFELPILLTEQYPKGLGRTLSSIRELLGSAYRPIEKTSFSCLGNDIFIEEIDRLRHEKRNNLIVCGIETHICVYQTARDLKRQGGWEIHLAADATGSRAEANWKWGLELLRDEGIPVKPVETILYELLKKSGTPEFKAMLPYIK